MFLPAGRGEVKAMFFPESERVFKDHPKFEGVRIAVLVSSSNTDRVGVSVLEIAPGVAVPGHVHESQVDSIYVLDGQGQALLGGDWQPLSAGDYLFVPPGVEHGVRNTGSGPLLLFVHHSPPLF